MHAVNSCLTCHWVQMIESNLVITSRFNSGLVFLVMAMEDTWLNLF